MINFPTQRKKDGVNLPYFEGYTAIDESCLEQIIETKFENLLNIEQVTGPSYRTQMIRREIELIENELTFLRSKRTATPESLYLSA